MHFGSGHNISNTFVSLTDSKGRSPRRQAADELRWLSQRFIHPRGFGKSREVLATNHTVFLDAPAGSGRKTAAQMLLLESTVGGDGIHQLLLQDPENGRGLIDLTPVSDGDHLWLDLAEEEPSWNTVRSELSGLRASVRDHAARLVVILPYRAGGLNPELSRYRVEIERPSLTEVFLRCLRSKGFDPDVVPREPEIPEGARALRKIPEFVDLIAEARDGAGGQGDFTAWCGSAGKALSGWEEEVSQLVESLDQGPQRALLLVAAMLPGSRAEVIHQAGATLLELADHPHTEKPLLELPSLDVQFREIEAELDAQNRVRFKRLDYDSAIRAFSWTHMPELRDLLASWVEEVAGSPEIGDEEQERLVQRFTRLCLTERHRSLLTHLIKQWTSESPSQRRTRAAAMMLLEGLQNQDQSRFFRRQIYLWSRRPELPDQLAELLVAACRDQMAVRHPDAAVVRLHHLARNERGVLAHEALVDLVGRNRGFLHQMLQRISDSSTNTKPWKEDARLFLELADPSVLTDAGTSARPLITIDAVPEQLSSGWELVFALSPHDSWAPRAWRWLEFAAADDRYRNELLDVLVAGGARNTKTLSRLHWMTERQDLRPVLHDQLFHKINEVQGLLADDVEKGKKA